MGDYPTFDEVAALSEEVVDLRFRDSRVLETLAEILPKYLHPADMQSVFEELRGEYYDGLAVGGNLTALHNVADVCRKCPNVRPGAETPAWNLIDPDVVFVSEHPNISQVAMDYMVETFSTVGFTSRRTCLTYVNRCKLAKARRYEPAEVANCLEFLRTELQILRPKLVVPLGLVPTSVILGADVTLGNERGKVHWLGPWAVLPTYAPAYVLSAGGNSPDTFKSDLTYGYEFVYGKR